MRGTVRTFFDRKFHKVRKKICAYAILKMQKIGDDLYTVYNFDQNTPLELYLKVPR